MKVNVIEIPENWNTDDSRIVRLNDNEFAVIHYDEDTEIVVATSTDYAALVIWFKTQHHINEG